MWKINVIMTLGGKGVVVHAINNSIVSNFQTQTFSVESCLKCCDVKGGGEGVKMLTS